MKKEATVYIRKTDVYGYPDEAPFHPSGNYPEYPFGCEKIGYHKEICKRLSHSNPIYENIRLLFLDMGLDAENFGTGEWNPLKDYIKPGDTVLLKPNIVLHENHHKASGIDCVITNGSLIRAVADYVYIALKGKGTMIIADAPVQSCDFQKAIKHMGLQEIQRFYNEQCFPIELIDFRKERAILGAKGKITGKEVLPGDPRGYTRVDLKRDSMHDEQADLYENLRVTNYDPEKMKEHHNKEVHEYLIPNSVLQADVVINLPKPKTHRKAGITGAMKNLVGINGSKDWLPHHKTGSVSENGDEYLYKDVFKKIYTFLQEKIDICLIQGRTKPAGGLRMVQLIAGVLKRLSARDHYSEGSWWGNDTIWRTICDLNRLLIYADKKGELQNKAERKCISILDMIISGEGEGPLAPSPKPVGILAAGMNPLVTDTVIAGIMGFDYRKIPHIYNAYGSYPYPIYNKSVDDIIIFSNEANWNGSISCINYSHSLKYKPTAGWKGHIELKE